MKNSTLGIVVLAAAMTVAVLTARHLAFAGSGNLEGAVAAAQDPQGANIEAGLWNEGKAVFSDVKALDLFIPAPYARGYKPAQPIAYNHKVHVEVNQMECTYCHSGVTKSSFATIPSVELCMGCHAQIKADSPEIQKLKKHWDEKTPVQWEPVNNLPEHVRFNHQRHLKAGVGCQSCHGQVQKMDVVERVSSLKMGFCVSCHRENGASIDCSICHY